MICYFSLFILHLTPALTSFFCQVDGFIYLRCSAEICMKRLETRARAEEDSVPQEYLDQINDRHEEWFVKKVDIPENISRKPTLIVDCSGDLINDTERRQKALKDVLDFAALISKPNVSGG